MATPTIREVALTACWMVAPLSSSLVASLPSVGPDKSFLATHFLSLQAFGGLHSTLPHKVHFACGKETEFVVAPEDPAMIRQ